MNLYHFSEDVDVTRFEPTPPPGRPDGEPLVWAVAEDRAPLYWFPRDCPRIAFWALPTTTPQDQATFLGQTAAKQVLTIEGAWLDRVRDARMYAYRLAPDSFRMVGMDGYFVSKVAVTPLDVEPVGDVLKRLRDAGVELRITPSLWPLHDALLESTLHFSMLRMKNAGGRAEEAK